jgi:hypothetical protein
VVKSQVELKRLIKRNQKERNAVKKAVGRKRGPKTAQQKQEEQLVCKIPFLVVQYVKDPTCSDDPIMHLPKKMKLKAARLKCFGSSTILSKMKMHELS